MTKEQISAVLDDVLSWPEPDQEELAEAAREIRARRNGEYAVTDDERHAIENAKSGGLVAPNEVTAFWKRHNIG